MMEMRIASCLVGALTIGMAPFATSIACAQDADSTVDEELRTETVASEECDGDDDDPSYGDAGIWEIGGTIGGFWTPDAFTLNIGPSVGLFVIDYLELTLSLRLLYENVRDDDGQRTDGTTFETVLEPSYHLPIHEDRIFLLGGLGFGAAYDGTTLGFEIVPRVGMNFTTGTGGLITPSIRVPIIMGTEHDDSGEGHFNVSPNVGFEIGYSNAF